MEELELRMYFFVPYNISEIQKGIQAGHAALEYARVFGETELFQDFAKNHKTWIILNGGTTNNDLNNRGSLQLVYDSIVTFNMMHRSEDNIDFTTFYEPDLNQAMTAICFICDQRVWDYKKYPDMVEEEVFDGSYTIEDIAEIEQNWKRNMGGEGNIFLRNLIKGVKLA